MSDYALEMLGKLLTEFLDDCGYDTSKESSAYVVWSMFQDYLDNNTDGG